MNRAPDYRFNKSGMPSDPCQSDNYHRYNAGDHSDEDVTLYFVESRRGTCGYVTKYVIELKPDGKERFRTVLPTFTFNIRNFLMFLSVFVLLIFTEKLYREPLKEYSYGEYGIKYHQKTASERTKTICDWLHTLHTHSNCDGFLLYTLFISLAFAPRSRFLYYVSLLALEQVVTKFMKCIYMGERPFWIDGDIKP